MLRPLYPRTKMPGILIGAWMGLRGGLDILEKRKVIFSPAGNTTTTDRLSTP
jgi:hypothetical protein